MSDEKLKLPRRITFNDFPALLKEIPDPPKELYIEGEFPNENSIFLGVVGTRKFSTYGKQSCEKIIAGLRGYNIVIVSGLAIGIDAIAHRAALDAGLKTVAIPGSGIDRSVLHPRSNHRLADEIIRNGGALLSEFEPEMPAGIHTFPIRNRIIAGLSHATLVIEAPLRSGTSITARLALEYNRDVYAVPGSIFSINSIGSNKLIRQGATPITSSDELIDSLGLNPKESKQEEINFTDNERQILDALSEPTERDELSRSVKLTPRELNPLLMTMEIKGLIKEMSGKIFKNI
ncbi:MAG: DNA-protecting protein DprA [Parcubacteria group bacterium CG10_big_fil_rev_8_21_14_0_10_38_31]|nr:MAG: DNA-protecting protein DprA [Parcubacteria group bacterium CG10_big_fil_rev_8_21_14_0_10_38_31]